MLQAVCNSVNKMPENYVEDIGQINAAESQSCNFARRLLKQPGLLLYGLSQFFSILAVYVPSVYLKEFMNKEVPDELLDNGCVDKSSLVILFNRFKEISKIA